MPEEVIERDANDEQVSPEQPVEKGKKEVETVTLSRAEVESLRRERDEARESERYWSGLARTAKPAQAEAEPEEEDVDPDEANDTLVDDFSSKGIKALVDRGMLTKKAARELIQKEAGKIARQIVGQAQQKATTDNTIMGKFPELKDPNSELYKQTRIELQELVDLDPSAAKSPTALFAAAKAAKAALAAKKPARRSDDDERYEYEGDEDETMRRMRADSQGARRGRPSRESVDDDTLPPQARAVLAGMYPDKTEEQRLAIFHAGKKRSR